MVPVKKRILSVMSITDRMRFKISLPELVFFSAGDFALIILNNNTNRNPAAKRYLR